jgi:alkylation response protein AidB-like acyl-CoA dehydrogenase
LWSSAANVADWGLCLARSNWDVPKHRGLTWFLVRCDAPGLEIRPVRQINDRYDFCEEFFEDVVVPDSQRVGEIDGGWAMARTMLVYERSADGVAEAAPRPGPLAPDIVELARRLGKLRDPIVRQKIGMVHVNDFVGRALTSRLASLTESGEMNSGLAAYGKLFRGMHDPIRARLALEIGGTAGIAWDPTAESEGATALAYLNCRRISIAGGTNEMQRNGIGERILGLPREPSETADVPFRDMRAI